MTERRSRLLRAITAISFSLVAAELASAWAMRDMATAPLIYAPSTVTSFALIPGARVKHTSREFRVEYRINAQGFRGPSLELPKPSGRAHVLVLGDSFAFGHGVQEEEAVSARLEARLRAAGRDVRAINAGFASGTSPDDALAFLTAKGDALQPDVVIELIFLLNDLRDVSVHRWPEVDPDGLPRRVVNPTEGPNELGGRGPIPWYRRWPVIRGSATAQLLGRAYFALVDLPRRNRELEDWAAAYQKEFGALSPAFASVVERLATTCRSKGLPLVIGIIPTPRQTARLPHPLYDRALSRLRELLSRARVPFVVFDARAGIGPDDLYPLDSHWKASAHDRAAALLEPFVTEALSPSAPRP